MDLGAGITLKNGGIILVFQNMKKSDTPVSLFLPKKVFCKPEIPFCHKPFLKKSQALKLDHLTMNIECISIFCKN